MVSWNCFCGNFVKDKRFCPKCKIVRFSIKKDVVLCYDGLGVGNLDSGLPFLFPVGYRCRYD